jgi:hypothetical protein
LRTHLTKQLVGKPLGSTSVSFVKNSCMPRLCTAHAPQEGARLQLQQGQLNCGLELCLLLVEAYVADRLAPSEEAVQRVASLIDAFPRLARPPAEEPPIHECAKFVAAAVKWLRG